MDNDVTLLMSLLTLSETAPIRAFCAYSAILWGWERRIILRGETSHRRNTARFAIQQDATAPLIERAAHVTRLPPRQDDTCGTTHTLRSGDKSGHLPMFGSMNQLF